jgi:3-hydroxyisobutyrate dehydrogenase-like beta-hydroxyacid dehydrogenase
VRAACSEGSGSKLGTVINVGFIALGHMGAGMAANLLQTFEPAGLAAPLGEKDIRLALAAAQTLHVPMPLASLLRDRLLTLLARGGDALDWSAIGQLAAQDAGLGEVPRTAREHGNG